MNARQAETIPFNLPVGALNGLGALSYSLAKPLEDYSRRYQESTHELGGAAVVPEWDLRRVAGKRINIAALTAFIAIAYRLRLFTQQPAHAKLAWDRAVIHFLRSTGALALLRKYDLVAFSDDDLAAYTHDLDGLNPATRFLLFDKTAEFAEISSADFNSWKDGARRELAAELYDYTRSLFRPTKRLTLRPTIEQKIVAASAELCLNANFWGRSPAVIGLQRSGAGISVAVADCGYGMLATLRRRVPLTTHAGAVLAAAVYNQREYGLYRVIDEITALPGGWASLWSFDSELLLRRQLWDNIKNSKPAEIAQKLPLTVQRGKIDEDARRLGYLRQWSAGIRGVRVTFEISFQGQVF